MFRKEHEAITDFISFLEDHPDYSIMSHKDGYSYPYQSEIEQLIAEFFSIDYFAFKEEKEAVYQAVKAQAERELMGVPEAEED